jgi:dipeptidyl aminopeptidase/acylaminoacyl peptidase
MKIPFIVLLFYYNALLGQVNGEIISRSKVDFPRYEDSPSIEMYYDKDTYEKAIADHAIKIEKIWYYSDRLKVIAYLSAPANYEQNKYPVIIFNRGSTVRNDISYVHAPLFKKLTQAGFIVVAPALRESEGGEGKDQVGGDDLNDIINILPLLHNLGIADTSNLFMLGESRGGIMTYLAIKKEFPLRAAATVGAITDMSLFIEDFPNVDHLF